MQKANTNGREKTKQGAGKRILGGILNNLGLKLLSAGMAVVLWFLVVMADNPKDSVSFSNVPVALINTALLEEGNKFYEVLEGSDRIRVTVEAPRNVVNQLSVSDIVAEADISRLTEVNTVPISYRVLNDGVRILNITGSRDVVRLNVEEKAKRWVNVRCTEEGEVAEGYIVASTKIDQTRMEVVGPKSVIESISYVGLTIDVSGATSNVSGNVDIRFYDAENRLVSDSNIEKNADSMHVEVQVLAAKEIPIEAVPTGVPAEGYMATGAVEFDPPTVVIAGTQSALADISRILISEKELDITGADRDVEKVIDIRKYLESTRLADSGFSGRVAVKIYIEPVAERTLLLPQNNILVTNLPEGAEWEFAEGQNILRLKVSGLSNEISAIEQNRVQGIVDVGEWMKEKDMKELAPGIYEIEVGFAFPEDIDIVSGSTVKINIRKPAEE